MKRELIEKALVQWERARLKAVAYLEKKRWEEIKKALIAAGLESADKD